MATKKSTSTSNSAFDRLRKQRGKNIDKLTAEAAKLGKKDYEDPRYWKPTIDSAKNGSATIRFLPTSAGDELPWVRIFTHSFKNPKNGLWMIENCRTTINEKCPVCEYNSTLWNSGTEAKKNLARNQKRKERFIANVFVVDDPAKPENNGKVFLYSFGKKIFEKIQEAMSPEFEDEIAIDPFDFWEGANFKLRIRDYEGFVNYDKSKFEDPSPLFDDDSKLEAVYDQLFCLAEEVGADKFKAYEEVAKRLDTVLNGGAANSTVESKVKKNTLASSDDDEEEDEVEEKVLPARKKAGSAVEKDEDEEDDIDYDDDEDEIAKLKELIADD